MRRDVSTIFQSADDIIVRLERDGSTVDISEVISLLNSYDVNTTSIADFDFFSDIIWRLSTMMQLHEGALDAICRSLVRYLFRLERGSNISWRVNAEVEVYEAVDTSIQTIREACQLANERGTTPIEDRSIIWFNFIGIYRMLYEIPESEEILPRTIAVYKTEQQYFAKIDDLEIDMLIAKAFIQTKYDDELRMSILDLVRRIALVNPTSFDDSFYENLMRDSMVIIEQSPFSVARLNVPAMAKLCGCLKSILGGMITFRKVSSRTFNFYLTFQAALLRGLVHIEMNYQCPAQFTAFCSWRKQAYTDMAKVTSDPSYYSFAKYLDLAISSFYDISTSKLLAPFYAKAYRDLQCEMFTKNVSISEKAFKKMFDNRSNLFDYIYLPLKEEGLHGKFSYYNQDMTSFYIYYMALIAERDEMLRTATDELPYKLYTKLCDLGYGNQRDGEPKIRCTTDSNCTNPAVVGAIVQNHYKQSVASIAGSKALAMLVSDLQVFISLILAINSDTAQYIIINSMERTQNDLWKKNSLIACLYYNSIETTVSYNVMIPTTTIELIIEYLIDTTINIFEHEAISGVSSKDRGNCFYEDAFLITVVSRLIVRRWRDLCNDANPNIIFKAFQVISLISRRSDRILDDIPLITCKTLLRVLNEFDFEHNPSITWFISRLRWRLRNDPIVKYVLRTDERSFALGSSIGCIQRELIRDSAFPKYVTEWSDMNIDIYSLMTGEGDLDLSKWDVVHKFVMDLSAEHSMTTTCDGSHKVQKICLGKEINDLFVDVNDQFIEGQSNQEKEERKKDFCEEDFERHVNELIRRNEALLAYIVSKKN